MSTSTALAVIDIAGRRAAASIRKGQQAWTQIKVTAEEQRTLWLEVGVALMYGKIAENRKQIGTDSRGRTQYETFSKWVQGMFPGLSMRDASDAQWFSENSVVTSEIPAGLAHPQNIRQWFNAQESTQDIPSDLSQDPDPAPSLVLEARPAEKLAKLIHRSRTGDEGSPIADRAVRAYAKKYGVTHELLEDAVKVQEDV